MPTAIGAGFDQVITGVTFVASVTLSANTSLTVPPGAPSEAVTRIFIEPKFASAGVPLNVRVLPVKVSQPGSEPPPSNVAV